MKILIIRFSSLGDLAMATALPRVLRKKFPDARIDMVVRNDMRHVIEWNPYINNKIFLEKGRGFAGLEELTRSISETDYDIIIDAHRSLRSKYICFKVKKPQKFYLDKRTFKRLLLIYTKINLFEKNVMFNMEEYIKPLNKIGVYYDNKGTEIFIPQETRNKVDGILKATVGNFAQKKLIGIVPSAQWPGKRWPAANFKKLAELISGRMDANIIAIGGRNDIFCDKIADGVKNVFSFSGKLSIIESAAALASCNVVIANDTGMMHVAEAVGTDVIGIMGPTSVEFGCYPFRKRSMVVEKKMWCRPCSKNGWGPCIRMGKRPCLNGITPENVFSRLMEYFKK